MRASESGGGCCSIGHAFGLNKEEKDSVEYKRVIGFYGRLTKIEMDEVIFDIS